jgi:hypothetical protein
MPDDMKELIIKTVSGIAALLGLLMLVGEMPGASIAAFAAAKLTGAALVWGAAKAYEKFIPEDA